MFAFLEPYYSGSHKYFADGFIKCFPEQIQLFVLQGRHWKWRMHGSAVTFAGMIEKSGEKFDTIVASSLTDTALLKSLVLPKMPETRFVTYFHENQLAYPWSEDDREPSKTDMHYSFINFTSALVSDTALFNSEFNRESFFTALEGFLRSFPDHRLTGRIDGIYKKSKVLYPGVNMIPKSETAKGNVLRILWNHRWEYDKDPETFFGTMFRLKEAGINFQLVVAGEEKSTSPGIFEVAREKLKNEIISFGYVEKYDDYKSLIAGCDILPVTSKHEFFGISVLEAASAGVIPVLPKRLSYPEIFPQDKFAGLFYEDGKLSDFIKNFAENPDFSLRNEVSERASLFDWNHFKQKAVELFFL
ncbi:DUF3524 domain-containing protein [bacterium]|nr:DUF3524 domain-containing protein [bacterium]